MEKIENYQPSSKSSEQPALLSDRALQIWSGLTEMFGKPMVDNYGSTPPRLWCETIGRLADDQLSRGMQRIGESPRRFPPTLPEFVEACRRTERQTDTRVPRITGPGRVSMLCARAVARQESGIPRFRGTIIDPYAIPGRRGPLRDWLDSHAPKDVRTYCEELVVWTKANPRLAFPGATRLLREIGS